MMFAIYCMLVFLPGTLAASFPKSGKVDENFPLAFKGLSTEFEHEVHVTEDEVPNKQIQTEDVSVPEAACGGPRPAFYAYLSRSQCYHTGATVKFDRVWLNNGHRYSTSSGVFVVAESGVYSFSWTVTAEKGTWFITELRVNSSLRGRIMSDSDLSGPANGIHPATGVAVVNVKKGDHVFIRYVSGRGCTMESDSYTLSTFSGWRIDMPQSNAC